MDFKTWVKMLKSSRKEEWKRLYTRMKFEDQLDSLWDNGCLGLIALLLIIAVVLQKLPNN